MRLKLAITNVALTLILTLAGASAAFAHDPGGRPSAPTEGTRDVIGTGFNGTDSYSGSSVTSDTVCVADSSASTRQSGGVVSAAGTPQPGVQCPNHESPKAHKHRWMLTTGQYYGFYWYQTPYACGGPCSISQSFSISRSNAWGASIGFSRGAISGGLGFDVGHSQTSTVTINQENPNNGVEMRLKYKDGYFVTTGGIQTDYYKDARMWIWEYAQIGSGWGAKFDVRTWYMERV